MFSEEHYSQHDGSAQTCPIYRESSVECFVSEQRDKYETTLVFPVVCVPRDIPGECTIVPILEYLIDLAAE